jgi:hypothetical protein
LLAAAARNRYEAYPHTESTTELREQALQAFDSAESAL